MRKANMRKVRKWLKTIVAAAVIAVGISGFAVSTSADEAKIVSGGETVYTDSTELEVVKELKSPSTNISVKIMKDNATGRYFFAVSNNNQCVIQASRIGLNTESADFTNGVIFKECTEPAKVTDEYVLYNGKHDGNITDTCTEYSFVLEKGGKQLTVTMRAYDDGVAYQYSMNEGASIIAEASEYVFADDARMWSYTQSNVTYEGTYTEISDLVDVAGLYTTPSLVQSGNNWILLTEGSTFDDEENYCSSYYQTKFDSKSICVKFGNKQTGNVVMSGAFETPWRVAIIGEDLNTIANSDIVTSVCEPAADMDYSFVKPGKLAWSWWSSTGDDPIAFEPQYEYIDFAAENGWEYVCLDYGWVLWADYKTKVKELVDYAEEKGVGIWLWYGVNNVGHSAAGAYPKYSLLDEQTIKTEMSWANSIGVKGVKVDYYESDSQNTMNQMYLCAKICAENELMVLFHGCTNPSGENRTFPNVLSYEAIYGAEYYKWRTEPSTANIITYLFTRNAIGSADFTPTCLPVAGIDATYGFMLGTAIYVESGLIHFAENVNVYEGYAGLSLMNDMPCTWDKSIVLEGYPRDYGTVARKSGDEWYIASLTTKERTTEILLDFLDVGKEYTAYIYKTNGDNSNVQIETRRVTSSDTLNIDLADNDGFAAKITTEAFDITTSYEDNNTYYEAEKAERSGAAVLSTNSFSAQYSSGCQLVEYIGNGADNAVTYTVEVSEAGVYEVNVYYVSGNDRRFMVSVNGNDENRIRTGALNSGDWVTVKKETLYLELESGENTIKLYNDETYGPNLDRISVSKATTDKAVSVSDETQDEVATVEGAGYEYSVYEAENAKVANGATIEGSYVGWLGGGSTLTLENITVEEAGKYYLMLQYMTGEDRNVEVSVNGGEKIAVACPSSGDYFSNPAVVYLEVELQAGANTIELSNASGYAPNIDSIGVSTAMVMKEEATDEAASVTLSDKADDTTGNNDDSMIYILIGVAAVVALGGVIIAVMKKTKKKKQRTTN